MRTELAFILISMILMTGLVIIFVTICYGMTELLQRVVN